MKGLVLYDLYQFKALYWKNLLLISALYLVITVAMQTPFLLYAILWMSSVYAIAQVANDEGWSRFARALPVSSRQMAGAKYLTTTIYELGGALYAMVLGSAIYAVQGEPLGELGMTLFFVTMWVAGLNAVLLPCVLKWGAGRVRIAMILLYALLILGLARLADLGDASLTAAKVWLSARLGMLIGASAVGAIAVSVAGWYVTARVYEGREA